MPDQSSLAATKVRDAHPAAFKRDWRKLNTGRLLYEGFDLYNAALLSSLKHSEFAAIRNTHLNLLRHLDAEGTRMTDLATRSNLTKAAITGLVRSCRTLGLVTVGPSTEDARTRVVRFSPKGLGLMEHIQKTLLTIERRLAIRLGSEAYGQLRAALVTLSSLRDAL